MSTPDWSSLPSVVLFDLYHLLSFHDRLVASSTCKKWREAFYLYPNWRKLQLDTVLAKEQKNIFILSKARKHCRSLSIAYTSKQFSKVVKMLDNWTGNNRVQELHLFGSGEPHFSTFPARFQFSIFPFLENCTRLMSLFLSHFDDTDRLYRLLEKHSATLKHLGIGKLYNSTACYKPNDTSKMLNIPSLPDLLILQLDGNHVTEDLLLKCIVNLKKLKRLIFNIREDCLIGNIPQETWDSFSTTLPNCEIHINYYRITVTGNYVPCLLTKCNNITHLRMMYCNGEFQEMCVNELMKRSNLEYTIQSIWSIYSGYDECKLLSHPFVVSAWRFKNLRELLFSGAIFEMYDISGMIKLRRNLHISIAEEDLGDRAFPEDLAELKKLKIISKNRFNDRTLTRLQREAVTVREIFKDDFGTLS